MALGRRVVMGVLAAVAGLIEFVTISRVRSLAAGWVHFLGNATAITAFSLWNLLQGWLVTMAPLVLAIRNYPLGGGVSFFLLTGWLGGELVFRHHIGI